MRVCVRFTWAGVLPSVVTCRWCFFARDQEKVDRVMSSLGVKVAARDLRHSDPKVLLSAICSQWLPVSQAVLCILESGGERLSVDLSVFIFCLIPELKRQRWFVRSFPARWT